MGSTVGTGATGANPTTKELSAYMPMVERVVGGLLRRLPPNVLREDLVAAGMVGLLDALRRNQDRGPTFDWYVCIRIRGAVFDELRAQDWLSRKARRRATLDKANGTGSGYAHIGLDDVSECRALTFDDPSGTAEDQVAVRMDRMVLVRAIATLPKRHAHILEWHYVDGVSFAEIAALLDVSAPRVSQLHTRALKLLREKLSDPRTAKAA
jgi:RNA polymerase sigma factor for flagellar operon FliA